MLSPAFCSVSLRTLLPVSNNTLSPASVDEPSVPSKRVADVAVPFIKIASDIFPILFSTEGIVCVLLNFSSNNVVRTEPSISENVPGDDAEIALLINDAILTLPKGANPDG